MRKFECNLQQQTSQENHLFHYWRAQIIAHWNACLWGVMSRIVDFEQSWAGAYGMDPNTKLRSQYLTCLYWAVTTMTTIGYGDIVPVTSPERVLTILVMCSGNIKDLNVETKEIKNERSNYASKMLMENCTS